MSKNAAVWINANPSFKRFDRLLIDFLSHEKKLAVWEYYQSPDEPCSLKIALELLHDYLRSINDPVHLVGHGVGGLLGFLYAEAYPKKVCSLTLLSVGVYPTINWQAHYYILLKSLRCSRDILLAQMVNHLFGEVSCNNIKRFINILERDLLSSPSPHSLFQIDELWARGISTPLMICGSRNDTVIEHNALQGWQAYLKEGDRLWECPQGRHFFHYFHSLDVGEQIVDFWQSITPEIEAELSLSCSKG